MSTIIQYQGPFENGHPIEVPALNFKVGISIGEKDFMRLGINNQSFKFHINDEQIWMGRTCIYECVIQNNESNSLNILFPEGAPSSCLVNITTF